MDKKPSLYDLFNDDSLWGNQTAGDLSHDEIMDPQWNFKKNELEKQRQSEIAKRLHADPDYKNRMKIAWDEKWADPKYKKERLQNKRNWLNANYDEWYKQFLEGQQTSVAERVKNGSYKKQGENLKTNKKWLKSRKIVAEKLKGKPLDANAKPVIIEGKEYRSLKDAAREYNITSRTMSEKIQRNNDFCYYVDEGPKPVYIWYYVTPYGNFCDTKLLQEKTGLSMHMIKNTILKNTPGWDYKHLKRYSINEKNSRLWQDGVNRTK